MTLFLPQVVARVMGVGLSLVTSRGTEGHEDQAPLLMIPGAGTTHQHTHCDSVGGFRFFSGSL